MVDVGLAGSQGIDFGLVDVQAEDSYVVACELEAEGEADVAETDDGDLHGMGVKGFWGEPRNTRKARKKEGLRLKA